MADEIEAKVRVALGVGGSEAVEAAAAAKSSETAPEGSDEASSDKKDMSADQATE